MTKRLQRISLIISGLLLLFPLQGMADIPFPNIHEPEGPGVECVQPEDEMRRNHMNYILHQRDETMYDGIRTETYSFAKCIDCHVQPDESGNIPNHKDEEHFCTSCHEYASVQIDCFECHADKPQKFINRDARAHAFKEKLKNTLAISNNDAGNVANNTASKNASETDGSKQ